MDEKELFTDVDELLKLSRNFRDKIEFRETTWDNEFCALRLFESQLDLFETISDLVKAQKCVEAFILNRTLFENYFLISLILKGAKYKLRYKVQAKEGETKKQAYFRISKELAKQLAEGRKDIVSYQPVKKYKRIEIIHKGLFLKERNKLIPIYYFVFEEYDPISHRIDKIPSIVSKDLFAEIQTKWQKKHEVLYNTYLGFDNILKAAILNDLITEEQKIRVKVHYNFLSGFTHLTKISFNLTNSSDLGRNLHYLQELNLLYVIRLLRLYFLLLIEYFSATNHKITEKEKLDSTLGKIGEKYDYFWFIFNEPDEYDIWKYHTSKEYYRKKGELLDEKVPYYKNPFERLRKQHQSAHEITTGRSYTSPWPRRDAFP